jgi:hypothetical protein
MLSQLVASKKEERTRMATRAKNSMVTVASHLPATASARSKSERCWLVSSGSMLPSIFVISEHLFLIEVLPPTSFLILPRIWVRWSPIHLTTRSQSDGIFSIPGGKSYRFARTIFCNISDQRHRVYEGHVQRHD